MESADLIRLNDDESNVIYRCGPPSRELTVREAHGVRWLASRDGSVQSAMRIDAPTDPALPNHLLMLCALLLCPQPERSLELGSGAGAIDRFLADRFPEIQRTCVDMNQEMQEIGKRFFGMPDEWQPVAMPAEHYLLESQDYYSLIFADLFDGSTPASCLGDEDFYERCARRLAPAGALALNLAPASEEELLDLLLQLRNHLPWIMLAAVPEHGNIVVLGAKAEPPDDGTLRQRARYLGESWRLDLSGALHRLERLPPPGSLAKSGPAPHE